MKDGTPRVADYWESVINLNLPSSSALHTHAAVLPIVVCSLPIRPVLLWFVTCLWRFTYYHHGNQVPVPARACSSFSSVSLSHPL
ncbi:hypothetical protein IAS59_005802 [Cryptococcus gattii]